MGLEMGWRPGEVLPLCRDRDITGAASGSPSCGPDPSVAAFSERSAAGVPEAVEDRFGQPSRQGQCRQVAGPGSGTRVPGKFTEQDSWDDPRIPRGT